MPWHAPIPDLNVPMGQHPGAFGAHRKYDVHTGVDLYCDAGQPISAVESGTVVAIEEFTGPAAGSPWWLPTRAVLVEGPSGVVLYGELAECVEVGQSIMGGSAGQQTPGKQTGDLGIGVVRETFV